MNDGGGDPDRNSGRKPLIRIWVRNICSGIWSGIREWAQKEAAYSIAVMRRIFKTPLIAVVFSIMTLLIVGALELIGAQAWVWIRDRIINDERQVSECQPGPVGQTYLTIYGSNTIGEKLLPDLMLKFLGEKFHLDPGTIAQQSCNGAQDLVLRLPTQAKGPVFLSRMGTETGFRELAEGMLDIAAASDRINEVQRAQAMDAGRGDLYGADLETVFGIDGIAVVVNRKNPINKLEESEIGDILCGRKADWNAVRSADWGDGGGRRPIHLYYRNDESGTFAWVKDRLKCDLSKPVSTRFGSSTGLVDAVALDRAGIGFVGGAAVDGNPNTRALSFGTDCGLTLAPTPDAIRSGSYPWTRRLYLYRPEDSPNAGAAGDFITFVMGTTGQEVLEGDRFVGIAQRRMAEMPGRDWRGAANGMIDPLGAVISGLRNGVQIRTTLRFSTPDGVALDPLAQQDLAPLRTFLSRDLGTTEKIAVIGFTDTDPHPDQHGNRQLSEQRARSVAEQLADGSEAIRGRLIAFGLGERLPVACNTTPEDKAINDRVEIWVYRDR